MNALPGQLELATVIDHQVGISQIGRGEGDIYLARQIAKMLVQYDDQPSSQLWADIQRLAREILK